MTLALSSKRPSLAREATDPALGGIAIVVGLAWIVAIGYAIYPVLPYNPVRLPFARQAHAFLWAPQGWAFFTRDPREEKRTAYVRHGSAWESILLAPHGRLSNAGGMRRKSRAQMLELGRLLTGHPGAAWQKCTGSLQACLATLQPGLAVRNTSPAPTVCGTVAIVLQKPIPWAWARSSKPVTMPFRVLSLDVSC